MKQLIMRGMLLGALLLSATMMAAACGDSKGETTPEPTIDPVYPSLVEVAQLPDYMVKKAEAYRKASLDGERLRNGVYVYSKTIDTYASAPKKLAARIALLGFVDVYLSAPKAKVEAVDPWLKTFVSTLREYGVQCWLLRLSSTNMLFDVSRVDQDVKLFADYNAKVAENERFVGISADLEPHIQKDSSKEYFWNSQDNLGVGNDNDQLLKRTHECLAAAKKGLKPALLNEAIWYNYQIFNDRGDLSYGDVSHFLQNCDYVMIMAYRNSMESIWEKSEPTLKAAHGNNRTVSIAIKTLLNGVSDKSSSIQQKGWNYLLETVAYLKAEGKRYDTFRGIDQFTYEGLETMWTWQGDLN